MGCRCIEIEAEVLTPAFELECSVVCEPWLGWEEYVDPNGDTYITIDGKVYKVKKR